MDQVKEIRLLDLTEMKKKSFVNINGTVYFGDVKISEDTFEVKNAIIVDEPSPTISNIVKKWATASNKGELRNPVVGGNIAYNGEALNEAQTMELEMVVTSINFKLKGALTDIANGIIASV